MQKQPVQVKLLIFMLFFILSIVANGQESDSLSININDSIHSPKPYFQKPYNIIKTNPLVMIWGCIPFTAESRINYEFPIATNQSMEVGAAYLGKSPFWQLVEDSLAGNGIPKLHVRGYRLQLQYKYYLLDQQYEQLGMYLSLHTSFSSAKFSQNQVRIVYDYLRIQHFNINAIFGYQWQQNDLMVIDLFTGIGYKQNSWFTHQSRTQYQQEDIEFFPFYASNLKIIFGFNIGVVF